MLLPVQGESEICHKLLKKILLYGIVQYQILYLITEDL